MVVTPGGRVLVGALLLLLCAQQQVVAGGSFVSDLAALVEMQKGGSLTDGEFSAAKQLLLRREPAATESPSTQPVSDDDTRRQLQQGGGGAPLPPPSGACPDLTGVQQALDKVTARVAALEVYTDISAAPRGLIAMWSGAAETVPQGWAPHWADGASGTPDLPTGQVRGRCERPVRAG